MLIIFKISVIILVKAVIPLMFSIKLQFNTWDSFDLFKVIPHLNKRLEAQDVSMGEVSCRAMIIYDFHFREFFLDFLLENIGMGSFKDKSQEA